MPGGLSGTPKQCLQMLMNAGKEPEGGKSEGWYECADGKAKEQFWYLLARFDCYLVWSDVRAFTGFADVLSELLKALHCFQAVLHLCEAEISSKLGAGEVRVRILASPINPADINQIQGVYPVKPPLPAVGGNEMVAKIEETGSDVSQLTVGDWVIPSRSGTGTWRTYANIAEKDLIKIDNNLPLDAAATFQVNPPTAYRMLKDFVELKPGDLVVQNGANSSVGRAVIQLARNWGLRTINVIRERPDFTEIANELKALGANEVFTEKQLKEAKVKNARLALNCVGGRGTLFLIGCLGNDGIMVTYGGMSKQPIQAPTGPFIFKNIQLRGFWMSHWYTMEENKAERDVMFKELADLVRDGKFRPPNFDKFKLEDWKSAIANTINSVERKQLFVH
ncbi:unnamed protein product [Gongylonema pulchrum]|uniref:Enoyl-[acyl-carrier-protein] reductase, mitochondrial n=1 Tax=Gongylonema pulchrum TaxID=637853 RepID=A0A183DNT6_9BILA|nr:unnamed protein product [Gongylonema pulchrum]